MPRVTTTWWLQTDAESCKLLRAIASSTAVRCACTRSIGGPAVLAGGLSVPLFSIQLHGLITKYLGETAAKLRLIFDAMRETRAIYLFDEFDALGADRASKNEVGEIRRVLNSFLQFLEHDDSDGIVIAATNHPGLLDRALLRGSMP